MGTSSAALLRMEGRVGLERLSIIIRCRDRLVLSLKKLHMMASGKLASVKARKCQQLVDGGLQEGANGRQTCSHRPADSIRVSAAQLGTSVQLLNLLYFHQ